MSSIFRPRLTKCNLQFQSDVVRNCVNSNKYDLSSTRFFASRVWQMVPMKMKNLKSLEDFKNKIRTWDPYKCDYKLFEDFKFRIRKFGLIVKFLTKTDAVLRNAYHVSIYLLGNDMGRLPQGMKYVRG